MAYTFAFYLGSNAGVVFFFLRATFCFRISASTSQRGAFFFGVLWGDGIME